MGHDAEQLNIEAATIVGGVEACGQYYQVPIYANNAPVGSKLLCLAYGRDITTAKRRADKIFRLWNAFHAAIADAKGGA